MNDRAADIHEWDAAYVLGSLSATDRALFEAHLEGCDVCVRSLAELAGLPGVLRMLPVEDALALLDEPASDAAAAPVPVPSPVPSSHRVRRRPRAVTRRSGRWILAAAAVVLVAGGGALGSMLRSGVSAPVADPAPVSSEQTASGLPAAAVSMRSDRDDSVIAELAVTPMSWGTRFDWSCRYKGGAGQGAYDLVAIADDGTRTIVASWGAGEPEATQLAATSSLATDRIRTVEITPADSDVVLASRDL